MDLDQVIAKVFCKNYKVVIIFKNYSEGFDFFQPEVIAVIGKDRMKQIGTEDLQQYGWFGLIMQQTNMIV